MNGRRRDRAGFTLVELLVVVVIIGILVGLLVPAVQAARRAAIRTKCIDYQHELGLAIIHYESAKGNFPGYVSQVKKGNVTRNVSWVVPVFQHLGRPELWEAWRDFDPALNNRDVRVDQLVCPADADALAERNPLSYVVNRNIFRNQTPLRQAPPDLRPYRKISMSDIKSPQITVLLMEGFDPQPDPRKDRRIDDPSLPRNYANPPNLEPNGTNLTFNWDWRNLNPPTPPALASPPAPVVPSQPPMTLGMVRKSAHAGGVVMTFCDGRVDFITDDATIEPTAFSYGPDW
jgi:prepilin-type N-terminal cleavage/methylation domain-containing protein